MKNIKYLILIFSSAFIFNACSNDGESQTCPANTKISMKINGEFKSFDISGWGIDLNLTGSGHTLFLQGNTGVYNPQQDTYNITLKLPYKKTGTNIIQEFNYFRVVDGQAFEVNFVSSEFQSQVTVNKSTCFSTTFSGRALVDGNEVIITEGVFDHIYPEPLD